MVLGQARCIIGIDTSCYTTSVAVVDGTGQLLLDERKLLTVSEGRRGLRQSEALFQHIGNLPELMGGVFSACGGRPVKAVVFSHKPRPIEGSYLPVFRAGTAVACSLAGAMGIPAVASTHQAGHVWAGIWASPLREEVESTLQENGRMEFLAVHLSGGTSELLQVELRPDGTLALTELGASSDLHAGQFVDRVGVALGLPFPSGPHLEKLAEGAKTAAGKRVRIPSSVQGLDISFSGPASAAMRLISQGAPEQAVAFAVFDSIAVTLVRWLQNAADSTGLRRCLVVGGVASNSFIRQRVCKELIATGFDVYFAQPQYSTDNAVGLAYHGAVLTQLEALDGAGNPSENR